MEPTRSAKTFVQKISSMAHAAAGKPLKAEDNKEAVPLVPIYIGVDRDHEQLREVWHRYKAVIGTCYS